MQKVVHFDQQEREGLPQQMQAQIESEEAEMQHSRVVSNSKASCSREGQTRTPPRVVPSDFELLKVVGQGSFGKVLTASPFPLLAGLRFSIHLHTEGSN